MEHTLALSRQRRRKLWYLYTNFHTPLVKDWGEPCPLHFLLVPGQAYCWVSEKVPRKTSRNIWGLELPDGCQPLLWVNSKVGQGDTGQGINSITICVPQIHIHTTYPYTACQLLAHFPIFSFIIIQVILFTHLFAYLCPPHNKCKFHKNKVLLFLFHCDFLSALDSDWNAHRKYLLNGGKNNVLCKFLL